MRPLAGGIYYFQNNPQKKGNSEMVFLKSRTPMLLWFPRYSHRLPELVQL